MCWSSGMASSLARLALCPSQSLNLVCKILISLLGLSETNTIGYYTLPPGSDSNADGIPDQPVPMVLLPHGGPWPRSAWGYHPYHQWLANRGYAVLSVNFRSSTGFGKAFINAGDHEWGGKIMQDQQDAVQWAMAQGIADTRAVAVMGGSFGGYSTLAGLTMSPDTFACGV